MARLIDIKVPTKDVGFKRNDENNVYRNSDGEYSPIVLEIGQIRERGIWANEPLITPNDKANIKTYETLIDKLSVRSLVPLLRLFEKRLYLWGWVGVIVRFYGKDKINYNLGIETRKVIGTKRDLDTGEVSRVDTVWYFVNDNMVYKVIESWYSNRCLRRLYEAKSGKEVDLLIWNQTHALIQINDWEHEYGFIPIVLVANAIGENGETYNGFNIALPYINRLDRLEEEIEHEIIATRGKTYFDENAFKTKELVDGKLVEQLPTADQIANATVVGIKSTASAYGTRGDNLNDTLKANVPVIFTQFDRNGLDKLQTEKDKLTTQIYTLLGFTNPQATSIVQRTATEMEYYNENTASTLKNMSLDRSNTLSEIIAMMLKIGIQQGYSGFSNEMKIEDLTVKVIPNIKTDENAFLDYNLKRYQANIITLAEFKEIIDNENKEVVAEWIKENIYSLLTKDQVDIFNGLSGEIDQRNRLKILFDGMIGDELINQIIKEVENERPTSPMINFDGDEQPTNDIDEVIVE